eukprot:103384-Rhodomonas_salina.2
MVMADGEIRGKTAFEREKRSSGAEFFWGVRGLRVTAKPWLVQMAMVSGITGCAPSAYTLNPHKNAHRTRRISTDARASHTTSTLHSTRVVTHPRRRRETLDP